MEKSKTIKINGQDVDIKTAELIIGSIFGSTVDVQIEFQMYQRPSQHDFAACITCTYFSPQHWNVKA